MPETNDNQLLQAMRRAEAPAIEEFISRFEPIVFQQARRFRIVSSERRAWVEEMLHRIALALARPDGTTPGSLTAYVMSSCRSNALRALRDDRRRLVREHSAFVDLPANGEKAVVATCSEASVRFSHGPAWDAEPISPALVRLVAVFDKAFTESERRLLSWVGQRVSYTTIAEWLGENRSTVVKRVTRIRSRIRLASLAYAKSASPEDRCELLRFFRRTGVFTEAELVDMVSRAGAGVAHRAGTVERVLRGSMR